MQTLWRRNSIQGTPEDPQAEETEEAAPEHHSMRSLLGTTDDAIIKVVKQVYQGEWTLAPSVLSHHQHDECMREYGRSWTDV